MSETLPVLTYFQFRGLGEPIRLLFHDLGLSFEDRRIDLFGDEWKALSPTMLFGQLPRLQAGDLTLFQSHAILRHLGTLHGQYGATESERLRCDVSLEAARDVQQRLWDHFWSPGSDTPEATEAFAGGQLVATLAPLERWLSGGAPYCGGYRTVFSDYFVLSVLDEAAAFFPSAMAQMPVLSSYRERMYERSGLAAYVASGRQPTAFGFDPARGLRSPAEAAS